MKARLILATVVVALTLGACGGDDDEGSGASGDARQGGSITIAKTSQPDSLDPALSYEIPVWEALWNVYAPLIGYRHAEGKEGTELIPYAAEELPEISDDGLTYRLRLREGLLYPDGTEAKASDFEHAIKRVLTLESGGSQFFLPIEGAEEYVEAGEADADIPGIETNDQTRDITITLTTPVATFKNHLATTFAGLVPGDTPFENLTSEPPQGLGPYQITRSVPNREFVLEKNPNFSIPDVPEGNLDRITTRIVENLPRQAQDVIQGRLDYMQDPPPADLLPEIRRRYSDRYEEHISGNTYFFFLNHRTPPFDIKEVRQAVNFGIDSRALARLFGGRLAPTCNFLPPPMIGFEEIEPCPYGDPAGPPDLERARELIQQAGVAGDEVTVWTTDADPAPAIGQYLTDMLNQIGLKAQLEQLDGGVYFPTVGNAETEAQIGFANWFEDFPHPANFMFLVDGDAIQETNNQNLGNVDDPVVNRAIDELSTEADLASVADEWAAVDRRLIEEAHVAPYGNEKLATFVSERMDFENCTLFHPLYLNDYTSFCLK